jgi:hypothetical protein
MIIGSWTYGGLEVDLKHKDEHLQHEQQELTMGPDGEDQLETVWVVDEVGYVTILEYKIIN